MLIEYLTYLELPHSWGGGGGGGCSLSLSLTQQFSLGLISMVIDVSLTEQYFLD